MTLQEEKLHYPKYLETLGRYPLSAITNVKRSPVTGLQLPSSLGKQIIKRHMDGMRRTDGDCPSPGGPFLTDGTAGFVTQT